MDRKERKRLNTLIKYEEEARSEGFRCIAGLDEAGRGPLAGPVVAAACIIPEGVFFPGINDSKKLTPLQRERLFAQITGHETVVYAIEWVSSLEIDRVNIFQATVMAMLQAVAKLSSIPDCLLVDGMQLPHPIIPVKKIIEGDVKSQSIAAASILAKVTRDRLMEELDTHWPQYGFKKHKGYGTAFHLEALATHGPCPIHRRSFEPIKSYKVPTVKLKGQ